MNVVAMGAVALSVCVGLMAEPMQAQSIVPPPQFEVVVVRPASADNPHWRMEFNPGLMRIENRTVRDLIEFAYNLETDSQVLDAPAWLGSQHFDIQGKEEEALGKMLENVPLDERRRLMRALVRSVLESRFQLQVEQKTTEVAVFALVPAKGGAKVLPANPKDGRTFRGLVGPLGKIDARGARMDLLASRLSGTPDAGGRIVLDRTGMPDEYDWSLRWTPETLAPDAYIAASTENAPSLTTALLEQLGLKLESVKASVPAVTIRHIEQPSEN